MFLKILIVTVSSLLFLAEIVAPLLKDKYPDLVRWTKSILKSSMSLKTETGIRNRSFAELTAQMTGVWGKCRRRVGLSTMRGIIGKAGRSYIPNIALPKSGPSGMSIWSRMAYYSMSRVDRRCLYDPHRQMWKLLFFKRAKRWWYCLLFRPR